MSTQLDRIERKLDTVLTNLGLVVKLDNSLLSKPDKYGFKEISTKYGGRDIPKYNDYLDDKIRNGDKYWKSIAKDAKRKVIVNYQLTPEQVDPVFRHNNNKYFMSTSVEYIAYSNEYPPAPVTVFEAYHKNNKHIDNHLIACAGNSAWPTSSNYEKYLDGVADSCIRYINKEYERITSSNAVNLK